MTRPGSSAASTLTTTFNDTTNGPYSQAPAHGQPLTYSDPESLLTDVNYPSAPSLAVHYSYDNDGRRSAMVDGTGSQSYNYDDLGLLTSATTTYTGLPAQALSYSYYPDGSLQAMITPAGTFQYTFDAAGRPSSLSDPSGHTSQWSYLDNG